jgi:CopG family nickel-responsive transcriptional regulator
MNSPKKRVIRFSVSLPPLLVKDFDNAWKKMNYDNRSKAAHDAFRNFISEQKWKSEDSEEFAGVIVLIYYLDKPGLLNRIVKVQHKFEKIVLSTMHIHLAKNKCLEFIAIKGKAFEIKNMSRELMIQKGVRELKLSIMAQ